MRFYSGDVIVWYSIIAAIAVATIKPDLALRRLGNPTLDLLVGGDKLIWILWITALAVGLVTTFRLFIACRHYLKIEQGAFSGNCIRNRRRVRRFGCAFGCCRKCFEVD